MVSSSPLLLIAEPAKAIKAKNNILTKTEVGGNLAISKIVRMIPKEIKAPARYKRTIRDLTKKPFFLGVFIS